MRSTVASLTLLVTIGCTESPAAASLGSVEIAGRSVTLMIGGVDTLDVEAKDSRGEVLPYGAVVWLSSNPLVASVDDDGVVRGLAQGSVYVSASHNESRDSVPVTVSGDYTASASIGTDGGAVALPSGTRIVIRAGDFASATAIRVIESAAIEEFRPDLAPPTLSIEIASTPRSDTALISVGWMLPPVLPSGTQLLFHITMPNGNHAIVGDLPSPETAPSTGPLAVGNRLQRSFSFLAVPGAVVVRAVIAREQTLTTCADAYELSAPAYATVDEPEISVVLLHGWQATMACWGENPLAGVPVTDFTHFDPLRTVWAALAGQIGSDPALGSKVSVRAFRYPSTLTPQQNAAELLRLLNEHPATPQGQGRVVLVGHSMGGLVARALDAIDTAGRIGGIITLGTPHLGARMADADFAYALLPSPGLRSLGTDVFNRAIPLPTRAPLHAIRGDLPCGAFFLPWDVFQWIVRIIWTSDCIAAIGTGPMPSLSDGVVTHGSAAPSGVTSVSAPAESGETITHVELPSHAAVRAEVISRLKQLMPPPDVATGEPEHVIGVSGNPHSAIRVGNDIILLMSTGGSNGQSAYLYRYSLENGSGAMLLPNGSPHLTGIARRLRSDGEYLYWHMGGQLGSGPYSVRRLPLSGGDVDTVVGPLQNGSHYEINGDEVMFVGAKADGSWWLQRSPKAGGSPVEVARVSPSTTFAVAGGEVFFEDCAAGTVLAKAVSGEGAPRIVASGLNTSNSCSDQLLVVGSTLLIVQTLAEASAIRSVSTGGGELVLRAGGLSNPTDAEVDGTHLYLRDLGTDQIIRFRLSDFARTIMVGRNCGGLALDDEYIYWASELAPAPTQSCLDGVTGPIVRLRKDQ